MIKNKFTEKAHMKKDSMTSIAAALAVLLSVIMYGAEKWFFLIFPMLLLLAICVKNHRRILKNTYGIFIFIMAAAAIFALCFSKNERQQGIYAVEKLLCFAAAFYVGSEADKSIKGAVFAGAFAAGVIGLAAYAGLLRIDELVFWDRGLPRLQSAFRYANTAAVVLGCGYFMSVDIFGEKSWGRALSTAALAAMYLTFSKAAVLIFLGIGIWLVLCGRISVWRFLIDNGICLAIAAVIAAFMLHGSSDYAPAETIVKRLVYMRDALAALKGNMLIGAGGGSWKYLQYAVQSAEYTVLHIHNGWLEFWLENGIFFVSSLMFLTAAAVYRSIKIGEHAIAASILLIALHSFVDFDLSYGAVLIIYGLMLGSCLYRESRRSAVFNGGVIALSCAALLCMGAEYALRSRFEKAYLANEPGKALSEAYRLKGLCPLDSELRVSIAALDTENAWEELEAARRLSPLDPELAAAQARLCLKESRDGVIEYCREYIDMAPKQEKAYAFVRGCAKSAFEAGICSAQEYDGFIEYAKNKRLKEGVTDRNEQLEELAQRSKNKERE